MPESNCTDRPCEGCAFTEGAAANLEPDSNLKGQLCVLGGLPFYCHSTFDCRKESGVGTKADVRRLGMRICRGWKREVAALAGTGYYDDRREVKRQMALIGTANLQRWIDAEEGSREKRDAWEIFGAVIKSLIELRRESENKGKVRLSVNPSTGERDRPRLRLFARLHLAIKHFASPKAVPRGWLRLTADEAREYLTLPFDLRIERYVKSHRTEKCGACGCFVGNHSVRKFKECAGAEADAFGQKSLEELAVAE